MGHDQDQSNPRKNGEGLTPDIVALQRKQEELENRVAYIELRLGIATARNTEEGDDVAT